MSNKTCQSPHVAAMLIRGQVMHERLRPSHNRFVYPVFYMRLNLARLDELKNAWFGVNCRRVLSIKTRDYGPRDGSDLLVWMRQLLMQHQLPCDGDIYLQTFPRVLGFVFNPVSFWYCHDAQGALRAVLAEVNNTFGESHRYLLASHDGSAIDGNTLIYSRKLMHVSPFCEVQGEYRFRFNDRLNSSFVAIDYLDDAGLLLKTSIGGRCLAFTSAQLRRAFFGQPLLTIAVFARIHWQALRLWWKKIPFYRKPAPPDQALSFSKEGS